jgi:hypothetical protein
VIFPIIPYGPDEILDPQSLEIPNEVRVVFFSAPLTGTVNLLPDGKIESSMGAGSFFGLKEEVSLVWRSRPGIRWRGN